MTRTETTSILCSPLWLLNKKETGDLVKTFPFKLYEFSDMTFPYTFPKSGTYVVTLNSKINGDPVYSTTPLVVDFDLPVRSGSSASIVRRVSDIFFDTSPDSNSRACSLSKNEKEDLAIVSRLESKFSIR